VARVLLVPGAAVRSYVRQAVEELRDRGLDAELLPAPGEPGASADLGEYGRALGARVENGEPVDLLIGLSVGAQAAAAAVTPTGPRPARIRGLVLVSPTTGPPARTVPRLVGTWLAGGRREPLALPGEQLPDWRRAGPHRVVTVVRSTMTIDIERLLNAGRTRRGEPAARPAVLGPPEVDGRQDPAGRVCRTAWL
jgi:pimeloyl-ACP methyl ester carboxylesterase